MELAERVIQAVQAYPGLTLYRLAILLDIDERQLHRAVTTLSHEERLSGRRQRSSIRWYTPEVPADHKPPSSAIRPGMRAWEALTTTSEYPDGAAPADIAANTRMSAAYVYKAMRRLEAAGLVRRHNEQRRWTTSQKGHKLLARYQRHK